ncbi:MAG: tetratricopeptide repeat protein [Alphaproteobacteria bacterium]|nr:tetratricopeptide repeat protein [Alphaproteobacteria bacterium]
MSVLQDFHFLRPYLLIGLIFTVVLLRILWKDERIQSSWAKVCDENLLNYLLIKGENKQRRIPYILAAIISFVLTVAAAGPAWEKKDNPALSVDNPVMIMLNLSSDMWSKDVSPSRIVRAKYIIKDLLADLQTTETGFIVYTREPFMITPMTEDTKLVDNLLPNVDSSIMPENGDRLDRAIEMAVQRLREVGYKKGNLVILTADVGERFDAALESAQQAGTEGFDVNIIKVSDYENDKLQMIADKGKGLYLNYNEKLAPLTTKINDLMHKSLKQSRNMQSVWEDGGYFLLWLPAMLLLYYFRKGVLAILLLMIFANTAYAGMFLNNNQEGLKYFKNGEYVKAADKFEDKQWKGAAAYKSGDYETALAAFSSLNDTTALYNQGNALAKAGKIDEAIKKYEQVLKTDANFEDARFNLEYLKKQQQNQQQQQEKQKQQNKQQQNKQTQNQQGQNQQSAEDNQNNAEQKQNNEEQNQNNEQQQDNKQQQQKKQSESQQQQQAEPKGENNAQQEQTQQSQQQQNDDEQSPQPQQQEQGNQQQSPSEKQDNEQKDGDSGSSGQEKRSNPQGNSGDNNQQPDFEAQAERQAYFGHEDPNGEQKAEVLQAQMGERSAEENEKIRARLQKLREIPEDKGGLLKAFIEKEYKMKRYQNE